jgi:hypothetical protein
MPIVYAAYPYAECRYAEPRYAECHYTMCRGANKKNWYRIVAGATI